MADTSAIDTLTAKLPPNLQPRFAAVSSEVRDRPPDDDLALALEVVGLAALTLGEVPGKISDAIGRIRLGLCDDPCTEIETVLGLWLEESCYRRLQRTVQKVKDGHCRERSRPKALMKPFLFMCEWLTGPNALRRWLVFGLCTSAACVAVLLGARVSFSRPEPRPAKSALPPQIEQGMIGYHEAEIPEVGGKVGMILVDGDVLGAFKEGQRGVVVVKPLSKP